MIPRPFSPLSSLGRARRQLRPCRLLLAWRRWWSSSLVPLGMGRCQGRFHPRPIWAAPAGGCSSGCRPGGQAGQLGPFQNCFERSVLDMRRHCLLGLLGPASMPRWRLRQAPAAFRLLRVGLHRRPMWAMCRPCAGSAGLVGLLCSAVLYGRGGLKAVVAG